MNTSSTRDHGTKAPARMVDLAELATAHRAAKHPQRIEEVFGDGVMLERLPPLARLRALVTIRGYRFVPLEELPDLFSVLPLVLLPDILDERIIPYKKNARALLDIADAPVAPFFDEITFEDISPLCLVHHESAHAVFFEQVRAEEGPAFHARGNRTGTREAKRLVETLVESEGFALGHDIFVALLAFVEPRRSTNQIRSISSPPHHLAEYERKNPGGVAQLAAFAVKYPAVALMLLTSAAYVANLRPLATNQVSPAFAARLSELASVPAGHEHEARELLSMGLTIDYAFRQRLAPTLFRYLGILPEFEAVLGTSLDVALARGGSFHAHVTALAEQLGLREPVPFSFAA